MCRRLTSLVSFTGFLFALGAAWWAAQRGGRHRYNSVNRTSREASSERAATFIVVSTIVLVTAMALVWPYLMFPLGTIVLAFIMVPFFIKRAWVLTSLPIKFAFYVTTFVLIYELYILIELAFEVIANPMRD